MLEIFRKNHFLNSLLLLLYASIIRIFSFLADLSWSVEPNGLASLRLSEMLEGMQIWQSILGVLLLFLQAAFINRLYITNRMMDENTLFPGLFYILLCSLFPEYLELSPVLLGNTFFIIALSSVFFSYKKVELSGYLFNVGFWLGIASLFYFPFIYFLPLMFVAISILRILKLKDILQVISGLITVFFLVFTIYYWNDKLSQYFAVQFWENFKFIDFYKSPTMVEWAMLIFYGLFMLWSILNYNKFILKKGIQAQKKINILFWALLFSAFPIFFQQNMQIDHLIILKRTYCFFPGRVF